MVVVELLKAFAIGLFVAVPAGPVLLFVLQKTLHSGRAAGRFAGAGSAFVDSAYSAAGLFALSFVSDFLNGYENVVSVAGGCLLAAVGFFMANSAAVSSACGDLRDGKSLVSCSFQAAGMAVSNPGAIVAMLGALAITGLEASSLEAPLWVVPLCVFIGELCYWYVLTYLVHKHIKITAGHLKLFSRISGIIIIVAGVFLLVKGITGLI